MPDSTFPNAAELLARIAELEKENALLRQKIDALARKIYGVSSEKLDPAQLHLLLQGLDEPGKAPEPVAAEAPRCSKVPSPPRSRTPKHPAHLPIIEEVIVPEPVKAAPEQWRRIGEEISERLDYEPARFLRRRTVRPKYVRRGLLDAVPVIAPLPPAILERSIVAPGLLAQIVVA
ncbi:transposase IS66-like protein, partial [Chthoniobacter flavus]